MDERVTLSVEEVPGILGISRALAYALVNKGEIPSLRLGRRIVVPSQGTRRAACPTASIRVTGVLIQPAAGELRRALGPVAWFVLEELLLSDAEQPGGGLGRFGP